MLHYTKRLQFLYISLNKNTKSHASTFSSIERERGMNVQSICTLIIHNSFHHSNGLIFWPLKQSNCYNCNFICITAISNVYEHHTNTISKVFIDGKFLGERLYIQFSDISRSRYEKYNYSQYRPSGKNRTCGPAIPVQRSNQLSYIYK